MPKFGFHQLLLAGGAMLLLILSDCRSDRTAEPEAFVAAKSIVLEWNKLALELERYTPGYRVPVTARMFAYVNSAAWQAALPGMKDALPLNFYFPDLPRAIGAPADFYLPASLNAAYAEILRDFFPTAPPHLQEKIQLVEAEQAERLRQETDPQVYRLSANYGKRAALAVWRWSETDSLGHDAYLYNFDRKYTPPNGPGCWQPSGEHPMPALLPYWGGVRTFIAGTGAISVKPPIAFDEHPGSAFYSEALEVYSLSTPLSKENRWIAELWSDDVPGLTLSPSGRWIAIANQAVEKAQPTLPKMLELYLKLGYAMSDGMVLCWNSKYTYHVCRPEQYIQKYIHPGWEPLHDSPSFPSYPSGHSTVGAAAAEVLSSVFGQEFNLTDRTHEDRQEFAGRPRSYTSFNQMAQENALSRLALGVHFRMDCEEGLRIGHEVGKRVVGMVLFNDEAMAMKRAQ